MAKVIIIGKRESVEISDEKAKILETDLKTISKDSWIEVDNYHGKAGDVRGFIFEDEIRNEKKSEYDLDDEYDKKVVLDFEKELKEIKNEGLKRELKIYGDPVDEIKYPKLAGFVSNPILGTVHWSEVEYVIRQKAINCKKTGTWYVVAEELDNRTARTIKFEEYRKIRRTFDKLVERREYASKQQSESLNELFD